MGDEPGLLYSFLAGMGAILFYVRQRSKIQSEQTMHVVRSQMDMELQQDISLTDAQPERRRKFTFDRDGHPILVIGICGGTGSGKTTLAHAIVEKFGRDKVTYISHDFYYKDLRNMSLEQRAQHNFDHPDSLDTSLMINHVASLRKGQTTHIPRYDFATHTRCQDTIETSPRRVILLEGILIFTDPRLVDLMDIKVFVETPDDIRFIRRLRRDMEERSRTAESVIKQYMKSVRPMHITFVEPSKRVADILIPQGVNNVALDMITSRLESFMAEEVNHV